MSTPVKVEIEYCEECGFKPRFEELQEAIKTACPDGVEIFGQDGQPGSFEVSINGKLVFSKLKQYGFPVTEQIVDEVKRVAGGAQPKALQDSASPGCSLL